jgi:hypothetical protein
MDAGEHADTRLSSMTTPSCKSDFESIDVDAKPRVKALLYVDV